ncbi:MAG: peptidylprolyl isomerase [Alphaproteobacteria bacterium]|nr:peptidylprolyl isomerase [Alphaproteobacteria bacterium]
MTYIRIFLVLTLVLCASPADAARDARIGIAAVVNDEIITLADVDNRVKLYIAGADSKPPADARKQMEQQVLSRLIDEKLQVQEARTLGIVVEEGQMRDAFAQIARQNNMPADAFRSRLTSSGVQIETLYDQIRAEIAWAQVVRRKLRPQINISETEIDSAMADIARDKDKPHYLLAEIFLDVPTPAQEADVRREAEKLVSQISRGAPFSNIAREFSQAPGAANGGDLGWMQTEQMAPALAAAVHKMKPGQISPPLRSGNGYHILFLREIQKPAAATLAAATPPPKNNSAQKETTVHLKQIMIPAAADEPQPVVNAKVMRAESLRKEITSCAAMDARAKDFTSPATGDLGHIALSALAPDVRTAIAPLTVGEISKPIRSPDGVFIVMVCDKTETTTTAATSDDDYTPPLPTTGNEAAREDVANKLGMQRLERMQEKYLRDLRAEAFVDKRI